MRLFKTLALAALVLSGGSFLSGNASAAGILHAAAYNSGAGNTNSYNWSGYVSSGNNFNSVAGTWTVPSVTGNTFSADAAWVGIGGVVTGDLIQVGTQNLIDSSGNLTRQAWYETLPGSSQTIPLTINAGDSITASLAEQGNNQWLISMRNNTSGQNYQTTITYNSSLSSAEWIEEMPSLSTGGFIPLDNFNSVQFSGATAVQNGNTLTLSELNAQPMTMVSGGIQTLATASSVGSDGESFTVSKTAFAPSTQTINPLSAGNGEWGRDGVQIHFYTSPSGVTQNSTPTINYRRHRRQYMQISIPSMNFLLIQNAGN